MGSPKNLHDARQAEEMSASKLYGIVKIIFFEVGSVADPAEGTFSYLLFCFRYRKLLVNMHVAVLLSIWIGGCYGWWSEGADRKSVRYILHQSKNQSRVQACYNIITQTLLNRGK